jgi:hypothetical protein
MIMNTTSKKAALPFLLMGLLSVPATAGAQSKVEIEVDPIAYAFNGFSLHVAKVFGSVRANVGTFGIDVPTAYHGNEGWNSTMRGAGVKLDNLGSSIDGFFVGVEGGYMRNRYALAASSETVERDVIGIGVRGGYRLPLGKSGLYLAPWVGLGYNFHGDDVVIAGEKFERTPIGVFPTVHVGWRF